MPDRYRRIPPLFSPRELVQLVAMIGVLCFLVVTLDRIRDPAIWQPFAGSGTRASNPGHALAQVPEGPLPEGGTVNPLGLISTGDCRTVDTELLGRLVRDKTGAVPEEMPIIHQMLCVAATTPPDALARQARHDVFFANLWNDPRTYRGKPIHIEGVLRDLRIASEGRSDQNPHAIDRIYEGWLFTNAHPEDPMRVLFTSLPAGLVPSEKLSENVAFDAYFLKIFRYASRDGKIRGAPTLIAYQPAWFPVRTVNDQGQVWIAIAVVVAIVLAGTGVFVWQGRKDARFFHELQARPVPETDPFAVPEPTPFAEPTVLVSPTPSPFVPLTAPPGPVEPFSAPPGSPGGQP